MAIAEILSLSDEVDMKITFDIDFADIHIFPKQVLLVTRLSVVNTE